MYRKLLPALLVVMLMLTSCAVRYYAPPDSEMMTRLTTLQEATADHYATLKHKLATGEPIPFADYGGFYAHAVDETGYLLNRAESFLRNTESIHQLDLLLESFYAAADLHELEFGTAMEVQLIANALDSHFRALLALENAKAREEAN